MRIEDPRWLAAMMAGVLVTALGKEAETADSGEGFGFALDPKSGHLRNVTHRRSEVSFETTQDLIVVNTSQAQARNDPSSLISHERKEDKDASATSSVVRAWTGSTGRPTASTRGSGS